MSGVPGALPGERASEWLDFSNVAAFTPKLGAGVKGVATVEVHVIHDRRRLRLVELHIDAIAVTDGGDQRERVVVQAPGIQNKDADRQLEPRDRVGEDHIL